MNRNFRVAVTGVGLISALGSGAETVVEAMRASRIGIQAVSQFPKEVFSGAIAAEADDAVVGAWCSQKEMATYDVSALFGLTAGRMALADSAIDPDVVPELGLGFGTCNGGIHSLERQWRLTELDAPLTREYPFYRQGDVMAQQLRLTGPVLTLNTACTAGATAMGWAYDMIRTGAAPAMLAGGSDPLSLVVYAGFQVLRALSPEACTPYGLQTGLTLGEGAAFVVLERWDVAVARKARIYAEILGYGLSNDGYHATASDPHGRGVETAVRLALRCGSPRIDYINTHGTGTRANDVPELEGLKRVFGPDVAKIPLSSSKGYFGHALGAAGIIEYVTTTVGLKSGVVPAIPKGPLREGTEGVALVRDPVAAKPITTFLSTNSAFGGHNCAIVSRMAGQTADEAPRHGQVHERSVLITGLGWVGALGPVRGTLLSVLSQPSSRDGNPFSLKAFDGRLYERRMNGLTQFSVAAAKLTLDDAAWDISESVSREIGVLFGTARGSLSSTARYLDSIYQNGPSLASSIDFPNMVLNSTLGKISEKLGLRGFSASLSTGGNDALMALGWGCESIVDGQQTRCLVGGGDELSALQQAIDAAEGMSRSRFSMAEGASFVALADENWVRSHEGWAYARVAAWAAAYGSGAELRASTKVLNQLVGDRSVDVVLLSSLGRPGELEDAKADLKTITDAPIYCLVDELGGYGLSHTSLTHLAVAASLLDGNPSRVMEATWPFQTKPEKILVVAGSIYGNAVAVVLSCLDEAASPQSRGRKVG